MWCCLWFGVFESREFTTYLRYLLSCFGYRFWPCLLPFVTFLSVTHYWIIKLFINFPLSDTFVLRSTLSLYHFSASRIHNWKVLSILLWVKHSSYVITEFMQLKIVPSYGGFFLASASPTTFWPQPQAYFNSHLTIFCWLNAILDSECKLAFEQYLIRTWDIYKATWPLIG